uniref:Uncharacterized protein n=1 Tax=Setaria italica TaxID=4555 RepID=K3XU86_SETIT
MVGILGSTQHYCRKPESSLLIKKVRRGYIVSNGPYANAHSFNPRTSNFSKRARRQRWPEQKPARPMGTNS